MKYIPIPVKLTEPVSETYTSLGIPTWWLAKASPNATIEIRNQLFSAKPIITVDCLFSAVFVSIPIFVLLMFLYTSRRLDFSNPCDFFEPVIIAPVISFYLQ